MDRKLVLALVLLAGLGLVINYYYQKPVESLENKSPDNSLAAADLFQEYESDEDLANSKYLNKVIEVSGTILNIDGPQIILKTQSSFGVICEIEKPETIETLKIGDKVVCKGLCTGKLMDVVISRCTVINQDP